MILVFCHVYYPLKGSICIMLLIVYFILTPIHSCHLGCLMGSTWCRIVGMVGLIAGCFYVHMEDISMAQSYIESLCKSFRCVHRRHSLVRSITPTCQAWMLWWMRAIWLNFPDFEHGDRVVFFPHKGNMMDGIIFTFGALGKDDGIGKWV